MTVISDKPERSLPHRSPFLWVHRLVERSDAGTSGVVETDIPADLELFKGHFPGNPVFPGVLQVEAAGQAAIWIFTGDLKPGEAAPEVLFAGLDSYKFKRPVVPPTTLRIQAKQEKAKGPLQFWSVEVFANEQLCSGGSFWIKIAPAAKP